MTMDENRPRTCIHLSSDSFYVDCLWDVFINIPLFSQPNYLAEDVKEDTRLILNQNMPQHIFYFICCYSVRAFN